MNNETYPTGLGMSTESTISLMGVDLAQDILGKVGFGELSLWMIRQQRPTAGEVRLFEAVLCALADHGFTPTAIACPRHFSLRPRLGAGRNRLGTPRGRISISRCYGRCGQLSK